MSLTPEDAAAVIKVRMENAKATLRDAHLLHDAGSLRSAVNRAYYAMLYAASALALHQHLDHPCGRHALHVPHGVEAHREDRQP